VNASLHSLFIQSIESTIVMSYLFFHGQTQLLGLTKTTHGNADDEAEYDHIFRQRKNEAEN
jgi:hypothetical protein